jgi:hypothetical protein
MTATERDETLNEIVIYLDKYIKIRNCVSSPYKKMEGVKTKMANYGIHYGNYLVEMAKILTQNYTEN